MMIEAMLYETVLGTNRVLCNLCARRCVISEGEAGFCRVRKNVRGRLFTLLYGEASAEYVDTIEKKSLFHFNPGSIVYSIGTVSCNFRCKFCINHSLSLKDTVVDGESLPPERVVELAKRGGCQGISYTYNEPTVFFEYAYDTAKLARKEGLFNIFVTNGYMTPEAVETIAPYLDAASVNFKGGGDPEFYRSFSQVPDVNPIYGCLKELKRHGIHVEVTNLVVPIYGDSIERIGELATWIRENLGSDASLHLLGFRHQCMMDNVPSMSPNELRKMCLVATERGLRYVYLHGYPTLQTNTYCPSCNELLIERSKDTSFMVTRWRLLPDDICPHCGQRVAISGHHQSREARPVPQSAHAIAHGYWGLEG